MRNGRKARKGYARASKPKKIRGQKNATEREYEEKFLLPSAAKGDVVEWWYERWTFKLADDTRYTPDFVVLLSDGRIEVVEVKGPQVWEDSKIKLKLAAEAVPFRFWFAQKAAKKHGGQWTITEVKSERWSDAA